MHTIKDFCKFELELFLSKRNLVIIGFLFVLTLSLTQYGIFQYKDTVEEKAYFQEFEKKKVDSFFSYRLYANYGFRIASFPSPLSILFINSAPLGDMITQIDTSERLKIYTPLQSGGAFKAKKNYFMDFSGMMFFLGSLLVLLFGFEGLTDIAYMKILASLAGHRKVFLNMVLARALLIIVVFLVILVSSYLLIAINGISIPLGWALPAFFLLLIVNGFFFFSWGVFLGTLRSKVTGLLIGLFGWLMLIVVIPMALDSVIKFNSNSIASVYKMEYDKWIVLNNFQTGLIKEEGVLKPGDIPSETRIEKVKGFITNEFKMLLEKDKKMIRQMEKNITIFQWLSSVFPTSNYLSSSYELSSKGYEGLIEFYSFALKTKIELSENYVDIVFVQNKSNEKFEPILKDGENVFPLDTRIPTAASLGVLLTLIYIIILQKYAHNRYKKELFRLPKKEDYLFNGEKHMIGKRNLWPFIVQGDIFGSQMFNLFSGQVEEIEKKGYYITFTFEKEGPVIEGKKSDFIYLPHIKNIPGHFKTGAFVSLLMGLAGTGKVRKEEIVTKYDLKPVWKKEFRVLNNSQYERVFLAMLHIREFEIYLIDDAIDEMSLPFAKRLKDDLIELVDKSGALVIFTTNENFLVKRKIRKHGHYYYKSDLWIKQIDEMVDLGEDKPGNDDEVS